MLKIINCLKYIWILLASMCCIMLLKPVLLIFQHEKVSFWVACALLICLLLYCVVHKCISFFKFPSKNIVSQFLSSDLPIQDVSEDKLERDGCQRFRKLCL